MDTLGGITKKVCSKEESWSIHEGFNGAVAMPAYTMVKLDTATGDLTPVTASTDEPLGILAVGCKNAGEPVTVHTPFVAIVRGRATAAITLGAKLAAKGMMSTDEHLTNYAPAAAGDYATGLALTEAASGDDVWVGVYRVIQVVPTP